MARLNRNQTAALCVCVCDDTNALAVSAAKTQFRALVSQTKMPLRVTSPEGHPHTSPEDWTLP
jgi:hypothetical protein